MLISLGHGERLFWAAAPAPALVAAAAPGRADPDGVPVAAAVPGLAAAGGPALALAAAPVGEPFGYLFPDAPQVAAVDKAAALDALAEAMTHDAGAGDGPIPAVMTYFGQFIDHDITANTNTEHAELDLQIGMPPIVPRPRDMVAAGLRNMRKGSLQLDSVYGDGPVDTPEARRAMAALRDGDRMRVGAVTLEDGTLDSPARPPLPRADGTQVFADLPRVGDLIGPGQPYPTPDDLPERLRPQPGGGEKWKRRAFIGDSRNDENLIVAQLHTAFLRFHNAVLDSVPGADFATARRLVTWHYQWAIVHDYLPRICDGEVLRAVLDDGAPLYRHFLAATGGGADGALPLPFEFSAAAFRFGHSMVRAEYDYNRNFNPGGISATLNLLFRFTGNDPNNPVGFGSEHVTDNWIIEWDRFTGDAVAERNARAIDTAIAPPLGAMPNETAGGVFGQLAARNLRRGHLLNLPGAQGLIARMTDAGFGPIVPLTEDRLREGATGAAIDAGDFATETPLWFYVLKEAEVQAGGRHLGQLGSRIVAETLVGLIANDPQSFLNAPGGWDPDRGAKPGGRRIDSVAAILAAAGVA